MLSGLAMPNQRKKGKKQITFFEWEHNINKLKSIARQRGIPLTELLRELTEEVTERYGKKYKKHDK
jgi:translation initiation factor 2 alpha subunit (eIF-2alpha)|tara:strand:- start:63 stop:260 length:198 start_codon:yes stop_codon:yes gene_type:complete